MFLSHNSETEFYSSSSVHYRYRMINGFAVKQLSIFQIHRHRAKNYFAEHMIKIVLANIKYYLLPVQRLTQTSSFSESAEEAATVLPPVAIKCDSVAL